MSISNEWMRQVITADCSDKNDIYTFCGALEKCYGEISYYWNSNTKKKNESTYENIILPALKNHNSTPISLYEKTDYEDAINEIKKKGYVSNGVNYHYSESTIKNFEKLIYYVVYFASYKNYCKNVLWGSAFELEMPSAHEKITEKVRLKKSLTPQQEKKLVKELFEDPDMPGEQVGVLIMLGLGTRNAEACGLNYDDIRNLQIYPNDVVAWIYKTTIPHTSVLQSGGKTWNAGRIVPVPRRIVELLERRKKILSEYISKMSLDSSIDIGSLPIVCKGYMTEKNNFEKRATAQDVTNAARELFSKIKMEPKQLAFIDMEIKDERLSNVVNEKEATAYLLRRNYATHLQILGLSTSEIQYLIGHNVEDAYEARNDFVDEERIHKLANMLRRRPLVNDIEDMSRTYAMSLNEGDEVRVAIQGKEPLDTIKITTEVNGVDKDGISGTFYNKPYSREYDRSIDIIEQYHRVYSLKEKKNRKPTKKNL